MLDFLRLAHYMAVFSFSAVPNTPLSSSELRTAPSLVYISGLTSKYKRPRLSSEIGSKYILIYSFYIFFYFV